MWQKLESHEWLNGFKQEDLLRRATSQTVFGWKGRQWPLLVIGLYDLDIHTTNSSLIPHALGFINIMKIGEHEPWQEVPLPSQLVPYFKTAIEAWETSQTDKFWKEMDGETDEP